MTRPNETSIAEIQANFTYDPTEGVVRWRGGRRPIVAGARAGAIDKDGYLKVTLNKRRYVVHRIAFALIHGRWPIGDIDHVNRVRTDNRAENLRECTRTQNNGNCGKRKHNKSGHKGVYWSGGKWRAMIRVNRKGYHIGSFDNVLHAAEAYKRRAQEVFGEFYSVGG